jgi:cytochrome P450
LLFDILAFLVKHLNAIVGDIFGAGSSTTSSTLTWSVLYLTKFPEVQEKLQKELDEVIGTSGRLISVEDKSKYYFY